MKWKTLGLAGLLSLSLIGSGCTDSKHAGAKGFSCERQVGGFLGNKVEARLIVQKGNQMVVVDYFDDRRNLEIHNLDYFQAADTVRACEEAIEELPTVKKD